MDRVTTSVISNHRLWIGTDANVHFRWPRNPHEARQCAQLNEWFLRHDASSPTAPPGAVMPEGARLTPS
eukprot:5154332-Prorocentrum_lima.AAC.1